VLYQPIIMHNSFKCSLFNLSILYTYFSPINFLQSRSPLYHNVYRRVNFFISKMLLLNLICSGPLQISRAPLLICSPPPANQLAPHLTPHILRYCCRVLNNHQKEHILYSSLIMLFVMVILNSEHEVRLWIVIDACHAAAGSCTSPYIYITRQGAASCPDS